MVTTPSERAPELNPPEPSEMVPIFQQIDMAAFQGIQSQTPTTADSILPELELAFGEGTRGCGISDWRCLRRSTQAENTYTAVPDATA